MVLFPIPSKRRKRGFDFGEADVLRFRLRHPADLRTGQNPVDQGHGQVTALMNEIAVGKGFGRFGGLTRSLRHFVPEIMPQTPEGQGPRGHVVQCSQDLDAKSFQMAGLLMHQLDLVLAAETQQIVLARDGMLELLLRQRAGFRVQERIPRGFERNGLVESKGRIGKERAVRHQASRISFEHFEFLSKKLQIDDVSCSSIISTNVKYIL